MRLKGLVSYALRRKLKEELCFLFPYGPQFKSILENYSIT